MRFKTCFSSPFRFPAIGPEYDAEKVQLLKVSRLFAALLLTAVVCEARQATQTAPPCGRCVALIVAPQDAVRLPSVLWGLDILVRVHPGREVEGRQALEAIGERGGRPGLLIEGLPTGDELVGVGAAVQSVVIRIDPGQGVPVALHFDLKTRLTALRARLPRGALVGISASEELLRDLLARDVAAYLDFVVGRSPPPVPVPWWLDAGELRDAAWAGKAARGEHPVRSLFSTPGGEALTATLADLALAARILPEALIPATNVHVACGERQADVWLDPSTLDHVAWISGCDASLLRPVPTDRAVEVSALSTGDLLVRIPESSGERFAQGVDVRAARLLSIQEVIARHQAAAARQASRVRTRVSTGTLTLSFEAPGFPAPLTITSETIIYSDRTRTEIEQRSIRVNGLQFGGGVPKLPLLEPERVASVPLAIELTDVYSYSLAGTEVVNGTACYVVGFEPLGSGSLFKGKAWIAADSFALVKVAAAQVRLRGPIVSSEQVDEFERVEEDVWLLRESRVNQVYEGAAHRTPIERVLAIDRHEINASDFTERRAAAYASNHVMLRDTDAGYRYLKREPAGSGAAGPEQEPPVVDEPAERVRTVALGVIVDPNISHPLPFAGVSYVDFNLFGTGTQFNGFFGGTFGQVALSVPSVRGSRWQVAGRAFAIASAFNDRAFTGGLEQYEQNIRQRPAHASVWTVRPLTSRVSLRVGYELDYTHYARADSTASGFVIPVSQIVHGFRIAVEGQRSGWNASAWWAPAIRQNWRAWGPADNEAYRPGHRDFQRYGASLTRSVILGPTRVARVEGMWMHGRDLDRFSRYSFGAFDNRLRGYPGALIRYDRGAVIRGAMAWTAGARLRLDAFADSAFVHDPGLGEGLRNFSGIGMAVEVPAPFGTLVAAEWGFGVQGRQADGGRGTHVFRVTAYRIF